MLRQLLIVGVSVFVLSSAAMAADDAATLKPGQGESPTDTVGSQVPAEQKPGADAAATQKGDKTTVTPGQAGPTDAMNKENVNEKAPTAKAQTAEETATQEGNKTTIHPGGEKK